MMKLKTIAKCAVFCLLCAPICTQAQSSIPGWSEKKDVRPAAVTYIAPEQTAVKAGKPEWIELRFHVQDGLHINSHLPSMPELIPTVLSAGDDSEVELLDTKYPSGNDLMLGSNPPEKLNVYTGDFVIHTEVKAQPGTHFLKIKLRFQACTMTACMPPKTIPITVGIQGE
jgi:hypothetical protein